MLRAFSTGNARSALRKLLACDAPLILRPFSTTRAPELPSPRDNCYEPPFVKRQRNLRSHWTQKALQRERGLFARRAGTSLEKRLLSELQQCAEEDGVTELAERHGPYVYTSSRSSDGAGSLYLRAPVSVCPAGQQAVVPDKLTGAHLTLLLDEGKLAQDTNYAHIGNFKVSPCHGFIGFTVDVTGDESFDLHIRRAGESQSLLVLPRVSNMAWLPHEVDSIGDSRSCGIPPFLYTRLDELGRACTVLEWHAQHQQPAPEPVLREPDAGLFLDVTRTKDGSFVTLNSNSRLESQVWLTAGPSRPLLPLPPRQAGVQYFIEHAHGHLLAICNVGGSGTYHVLGIEAPGPRAEPEDVEARRLLDWANWFTVLGPDEDFEVEDVDVSEFGMFVYGRRLSSASPELRCGPWTRPHVGGELGVSLSKVDLGTTGALTPGGNLDYSAHASLVHVSAPHLPERSVQVSLPEEGGSSPDVQTLHTRPLPVPSTWTSDGFVQSESDAFALTSRQLHAPSSHDPGVAVPVTLVGRTSVLDAAGSASHAPMLVQVYGAYGTCLDSHLDPALMPWLLRGWIVAFVHARGGGERGRAWYHSGRQLQKLNTMEDLRDAVQSMHRDKLSAPHLTVLKGHSAGGLPAAWLALQSPPPHQPHPVAGVILSAPFLDVLGAMSDPSLPLTVPEYTEWGDPLADAPPGTRALIHEYCPLTTVLRRLQADQPASPSPTHFHVTGALHDPRTPAWHQLSFVTALRGGQAHSPTAFHRPAPARVWMPNDSGTVSSIPFVSSWEAAKYRLAQGLGEACDVPVDLTTAPPSRQIIQLNIARDGGHHGEGGWHADATAAAQELVFAHQAVGLPLR